MNDIDIYLLLGLLGMAAIASSLAWHYRRTARELAVTMNIVGQGIREWEWVFDALKEFIYVTDANGVVIRVSGACARAFNLHPRGVVGRTVEDLFSSHSPLWLNKDSYVEIEDAVFKTVFEVTRVPMGDGMAVVARDVGERRQLMSKLVQADKFAAVGVLAAGVAHEINNPAAYVSANLHELLNQGQEGVSASSSKEMLEECIDGMNRIRDIVRNLQSIARKDEPAEHASVDLREVIDAVAKTAAPQLRSWGGTMDVVSPRSVLVDGSKGQLIQVVLNLVINAIQAADRDRKNHIRVELRRDGEQAVLTVRDTGKGISAEHLSKVFEPFFTTKPEGVGTGLGLAISREIVVNHGGALEVTSLEGQTTTVTMRLPGYRKQPVATDALPSPRAPNEQLSILLVDDEPLILRALERQLRRKHRIRTASGAAAALQELQGSTFDVVLCDVNMPGMDGFELREKVATFNPNLARSFIYLTGQPVSEARSRELEALGVRILSKPVDAEELDRALHTSAPVMSYQTAPSIRNWEPRTC